MDPVTFDIRHAEDFTWVTIGCRVNGRLVPTHEWKDGWMARACLIAEAVRGSALIKFPEQRRNWVVFSD